MNESENTPSSRIDYEGTLAPLVENIAHNYNVGEPICYSIIDMGYEDCNVIIDFNKDNSLNKCVAKIFAQDRTSGEVIRYCNTIDKVVAAGINHPPLFKTTDGSSVYQDTSAGNVSLVLMKYIDGKTFFQREENSIPTDEELALIVEQATKINSMPYRPSYIKDSWAIPNIEGLQNSVKQYLLPNDYRMINEVVSRYKKIPLQDLPKAFVHGDLSKTNVLMGKDGKPYILDFSVSNIYPRIQEIAIMAGNLMYDKERQTSLQERINKIGTIYEKYIPLQAIEKENLYAYALTGIAAELLGSNLEKFVSKSNTPETEYRMTLARKSLQAELNNNSL